MSSYQDFLEEKKIIAKPSGFEPSDLHPLLKDFQRHMVTEACNQGKYAKFAFTGAGKTLMEFAWADQVVQNSANGRVLGFAPLAVAHQMVKEGAKFGFDVNFCEDSLDVTPGVINITNYGKLHKFQNDLDGVFFDESSLIKNETSKTFASLKEFVKPIHYRLSATATAAPNDFVEFGTQAETLGVMSVEGMRSTFFTHDGGKANTYRLGKWAEESFWEFLLSWSTIIRKPSDLGYSDKGYILPPLNDIHLMCEGSFSREGEIVSYVQGMNDRRKARKDSTKERCELLADIVNNCTEEHLIWCEQNSEADLLEKLIPGSVQVAGRHTDRQKCDRLNAFSDGAVRVLISKPKIAGFGMNWQHCRNVDFVGINDSWESMHQATNRCWRFGQERQVNRRLIYSKAEQPVLDNLFRKQTQAERLGEAMYRTYQRLGLMKPTQYSHSIDYSPTQIMELPSWLNLAT